jgi:prepilin-type N-terminal cleavage/methylation domain-containing protein
MSEGAAISRDDGFTLIEMVCVLAVVAILAAILLPRASRQTSQPRLEAYAIEVAAILKADRTAAMMAGRQVATAVDATSRSIRSGATGRALSVADDVVVTALLPRRCNDELFCQRHVVRRLRHTVPWRPQLRDPRQLVDGRDRNCSAWRVLNTPAMTPASRSSRF